MGTMKKIVIKNPHEYPLITTSELELEDMQKIVGGYIEFHPFPPDLEVEYEDNSGIDIIMNEEGKLKELYPTMRLVSDGKPYDIISGSILFCSHDNEGDSIGLTDDQIEKVMTYLSMYQLM